MSALGRESSDATSSSSAEQSAITPRRGIPPPFVFWKAAPSETAGQGNGWATFDEVRPLPSTSTGEAVHSTNIVAELERAAEAIALRYRSDFHSDSQQRLEEASVPSTAADLFQTVFPYPTIHEFASHVESEIKENERFRGLLDVSENRQTALLSVLTDLERMTDFANSVSAAVSGGGRPVKGIYAKGIVENMWRPMRRYLDNDLTLHICRLDRYITELRSILRVDQCELRVFSEIMMNKRAAARDLIEKMKDLRVKIGKKTKVRLEAITDFEAVVEEVLSQKRTHNPA